MVLNPIYNLLIFIETSSTSSLSQETLSNPSSVSQIQCLYVQSMKPENRTGLDQLGPHLRLQLHAFQTTQPDRFGLVSTSFEGNQLCMEYPLNTCAHFKPILRRNGSELHELRPKQYVLAKSNFVQYLIIAFFEFQIIFIAIKTLWAVTTHYIL